MHEIQGKPVQFLSFVYLCLWCPHWRRRRRRRRCQRRRCQRQTCALPPSSAAVCNKRETPFVFSCSLSFDLPIVGLLKVGLHRWATWALKGRRDTDVLQNVAASIAAAITWSHPWWLP